MAGFSISFAHDYSCPHCGHEDVAFYLAPQSQVKCLKCGTVFDKDGRVGLETYQGSL